MNVIAQLEYELAYYDSAVHRFNHYTTRTPPVRLRTFRLAHELVRCKHERRCSRACGEDVSFRDATIESPDRNVTAGCEWHHAPETCTEDLGDLKKKSVSWILVSEEDGWLSGSPRPCGRCHTWFGADGKVSIERMCISLLMSKNLLTQR